MSQRPHIRLNEFDNFLSYLVVLVSRNRSVMNVSILSMEKR